MTIELFFINNVVCIALYPQIYTLFSEYIWWRILVHMSCSVVLLFIGPIPSHCVDVSDVCVLTE